jgi:hypothetical protein
MNEVDIRGNQQGFTLRTEHSQAIATIEAAD